MTNLYDKFDFIRDRIKDKNVLDVGCVQVLHDFSPERMKETQHYKLRNYAKQLVEVLTWMNKVLKRLMNWDVNVIKP